MTTHDLREENKILREMVETKDAANKQMTMPIPDAQAGPPEPPTKEPNDENPDFQKAVLESNNQLSRDYQDAWKKHVERMKGIGITYDEPVSKNSSAPKTGAR